MNDRGASYRQAPGFPTPDELLAPAEPAIEAEAETLRVAVRAKLKDLADPRYALTLVPLSETQAHSPALDRVMRELYARGWTVYLDREYQPYPKHSGVLVLAIRRPHARYDLTPYDKRHQ